MFRKCITALLPVLLFSITASAQRGRFRRLDTSLHDLKSKSSVHTVAVGKIIKGGSSGYLAYIDQGLDRRNQRYRRVWYMERTSFLKIAGGRKEFNKGSLPVKLILRINRQSLRIQHYRTGNRITARYWCTVIKRHGGTAVKKQKVDTRITLAINAEMISKKLDGTTRIEPGSRVRRSHYKVYIIPTKDFDRFFPKSIVRSGSKIILRITSKTTKTHTVPAGTITTTVYRGRVVGKK